MLEPFTAHIDQRYAGQLRAHTVMAPFDAAVANRDGTAFSYRNPPDGLTAAALDRMWLEFTFVASGGATTRMHR